MKISQLSHNSWMMLLLILISWRHWSCCKSLWDNWNNCKSLEADTVSSVKLTEKRTLHVFKVSTLWKEKQWKQHFVINFYLCVSFLEWSNTKGSCCKFGYTYFCYSFMCFIQSLNKLVIWHILYYIEFIV